MPDRHALRAIGREAEVDKQLTIPARENAALEGSSKQDSMQETHRLMVLRLTIFIAIIRSAASAMKSASLEKTTRGIKPKATC